MEEMEAKTPKSGDQIQKFDRFNEFPSTSLTATDAVDAKRFNFFSSIRAKKPGDIHPSRPTEEIYYDCSHANVGVAIIFNQVNIEGEKTRVGSIKDANDLRNVLDDIGFKTEVYTDLSKEKIQQTLFDISLQDHSDNDCLCITIMTHGRRDGKIFAADGEMMVQELWENFVGDRCKSLVGKPKLFFVQACRGTMTDPGILLKQKPLLPAPMNLRMDATDSKAIQQDEYYVIPLLADILIMYSTSEGYYSFRNPENGSWFIQALCEEFKGSLKNDDLMTILTGVNRNIAFSRQSYTPHEPEKDTSKQMPVIQSMLTKTLYFMKKESKARLASARLDLPSFD